MLPTKEEYARINSAAMPRSNVKKDLLCAFLTGGAICTLGQAIRTFFLLHFAEDDAALLTSVSLIALSALLTGLGVYDKVARHAGAGTLVPITGFANSVVSPALEFKSEGWVLGTAAKMFIICGPVIVYGTAAAMLAGALMMLLGKL
ncbi:MAG: stage V sporulation protein AC [Oscillospiraceae bacterium]|nr:stage V sporulation protein AC [Oscillospiraceae bacterium]